MNLRLLLSSYDGALHSWNLFVIYGGKYTTYRAQSEQLGRRIKDILGKGTQSLTHTRDAWFLDNIRQTRPELFKSSKSLRSA